MIISKNSFIKGVNGEFDVLSDSFVRLLPLI